ncbi:hypothetical protein DFH09DRAFT_1172373, partial [Mycena vulgaris]
VSKTNLISTIQKSLEHPEEDLCIAAAHMTNGAINVDDIIRHAWTKVLAHLDVFNIERYLAAFDKIPKLAEFVGLLDNSQFSRVESAITTALKDHRRTLHLSGLHVLSQLASNDRHFSHIVPKVTALLSSKHSDTRVEVLNTLLRLAEYKKCCDKMNLGEIISILKDRETEVRVTGLKLLLKLAQKDRIPDRIKLTTPHLLNLIQSSKTRKDAVALLTCLAEEKTLRAEILAKTLPLFIGETLLLSWGHLVLIKSLFANAVLKQEASDLRFVVCLMTSKHTGVQDFVLKFMTSSLQHYLETWTETSAKFPSTFSSFFSNL